MNSAPVHVTRIDTPEGQPQKYLFFKLNDAADADGKPVKIRQPLAAATMEQLEKDLCTVQEYIALVTGMSPA